jgi:hypothetical protein
MDPKDEHFCIFAEGVLNPVGPGTTEMGEFAPIRADGRINAPAAKAQSHLPLEGKDDLVPRVPLYRRL